ncbi:hypothetical protein DRO02_02665 [archaeon]|nr:MAG: hypothetical protein DRN89_03975 [archaeon]RLG65078.1 MAG: hypothetical protein DRO02_02665 [archaeon]RLG65311.1 MAG: hypothetical protein DRO21_02200 [archaeon]HDM23854.1 hypothetical protein [Candidatus Bathyarchaeota archaeon]
MKKVLRATSQLIVIMIIIWVAWLATLVIIDLYIVTINTGNILLTAIMRVALSVALFSIVLFAWYKVTKHIFRKNIEEYLEKQRGKADLIANEN